MATLVSSTDSLDLPRPMFSVRHSLRLNLINRQTRGLDRKIFRDSSWPEHEILNVIHEACTETQKNDFFTFIENHYGEQITLTDYEGRSYLGIITPGEITQTRRGCGYDISYEFEGTLT